MLRLNLIVGVRSLAELNRGCGSGDAGVGLAFGVRLRLSMDVI